MLYLPGMKGLASEKTIGTKRRFLVGIQMVARRKMAGLALVITGIIVLLTSSVVIAGEETIGTGFVVQVLIGVACCDT